MPNNSLKLLIDKVSNSLADISVSASIIIIMHSHHKDMETLK